MRAIADLGQLGFLAARYYEVSNEALIDAIKAQEGVLAFLSAKGDKWTLASLELARELTDMYQALEFRKMGS